MMKPMAKARAAQKNTEEKGTEAAAAGNRPSPPSGNGGGWRRGGARALGILLFLKDRKPANSFQEIGTGLKDGRRHLDLQQQPRAEAEEQQPRVEAEAELSAQPKQSKKSQKSH